MPINIDPNDPATITALYGMAIGAGGMGPGSFQVGGPLGHPVRFNSLTAEDLESISGFIANNQVINYLSIESCILFDVRDAFQYLWRNTPHLKSVLFKNLLLNDDNVERLILTLQRYPSKQVCFIDVTFGSENSIELLTQALIDSHSYSSINLMPGTIYIGEVDRAFAQIAGNRRLFPSNEAERKRVRISPHP